MSELLALLKLCDDPSPVVSRKVAGKLRELDARDLTSGVWQEIEAQGFEVSASQRAALDEILTAPQEGAAGESTKNQADRDQQLRQAWLELFPPEPFREDDEFRALEGALLALSDWQSGDGSSARGRILLDDLALEFGDFEPLDADSQLNEATALAKFLFEVKHLRGANADDYYNAEQSDITRALQNGQGLPITLACIFILVGRRVGLSIEGCSFPGHFLARDARSQRVFDPFNGGRVLSAREVGALQKAAPGEMNEAASVREIAARVLRNLSVAYYQSGESEKAALMISLLQQMDDNSLQL